MNWDFLEVVAGSVGLALIVAGLLAGLVSVWNGSRDVGHSQISCPTMISR